jgi:hypothetical protein
LHCPPSPPPPPPSVSPHLPTSTPSSAAAAAALIELSLPPLLPLSCRHQAATIEPLPPTPPFSQLLSLSHRRRRATLSAMPALGATDPADLEAQACAELGFSRQLKQPWQVAPHPSLGGSSGYPVWHHEEQLERWDAGEVTDVSKRSLFRWSRRLKPYHQTGNRERSQIIGPNYLILSLISPHGRTPP